MKRQLNVVDISALSFTSCLVALKIAGVSELSDEGTLLVVSLVLLMWFVLIIADGVIEHTKEQRNDERS